MGYRADQPNGITRRGLMAGASSTLALATWGGVAQATKAPAILRAAPLRWQLAPAEYPETGLWGFDGQIPGPELRIGQGNRLVRRVENALPQPTAVHWHGVRLDNAMDGVPGLTQKPIPPGGVFDYDFALPDAGTYWYHSHNQSVEQVARGLYGPLIVTETAPPDVDADLVLMLDDWRLTGDAQLAGDFDSNHDYSHAGRIGNYPTTNASGAFSHPVAPHERLRLRLVNTANARIFELGLKGLAAWLVALDGMPLDMPVPVTGRLSLAPAQRIDMIVDVTEPAGGEAFVLHFDRDGGFAQAAFPVTGAGTRTPRPAPGPLPPNPRQHRPSLDGIALREVLIEGGAMRWLENAALGGEVVTGRALAEQGKFWALNGQVGRTETPLFKASIGETIALRLVNKTAFPHGIHLHGHHFRELQAEGLQGPMRDTILIEPDSRRDIVLVTDNPGKWLIHCHMLGHHASGMGSWFHVV